MAQGGLLRKMAVELADPVRYFMRLGERRVALADYIGQMLGLRHTGVIECLGCGRSIRKTFNQGYCFPCSQRLARCDLCIVRPERCHYHLGTCREPAWGEQHCMQTHVVYLANTSGLKVGITRQDQVPTRWIDQGAVQAIPVMRVRNRLLAGLVEVVLARFVADKTDWRRMLKGPPEARDLAAQRDALLGTAAADLNALEAQHGSDIRRVAEGEVAIRYPVDKYPQTVRSLNFDKTPEVKGCLLGIKGQYLIFDCGVINLRKFGGYRIEISDPVPSDPQGAEPQAQSSD